MKYLPIIVISFFILLTSCLREPELHLYDGGEVEIFIPAIELEMESYWNYETVYGVKYEWESEWYYGWDENIGTLGYTLPSVFNIRRYYTGQTPYAPHTSVLSDQIYTNFFQGKYDWGFWDILIWNDIIAKENAQSLVFDETTSLDSVIVSTGPSMRSTRYEAPKYTRTFYAPEELFSAYKRGEEINEKLEGFEYDEERNVWIKKLDMVLLPQTYIYLTQVILLNNNGRVNGTNGEACLSGMARTKNLNTGQAGPDAISVAFDSYFKEGCDMNGKSVDIIGGRLLTFGICNLNANNVTKPEEIIDTKKHYLGINMSFSNATDSTYSFEVTDSVRKRFKGGVLTYIVNVDTLKIPTRKGGSGFDAVVKEYENVTNEFEFKNIEKE